MSNRKDATGADVPPIPSPPIPGPGNPPTAPPGKPSPSQPGDPIAVGDTIFMDPPIPGPAYPSTPTLGSSLNLEPLTGPTEASEPEEESEVLDLEGDEGLDGTEEETERD